MADGKKERLLKFDKAMGSSMIRKAIDAGWDYRSVMEACNKTAAAQNFLIKRKKYLIYK
jgi:uncharacterized protein YbbC (DUF1343 family)